MSSNELLTASNGVLKKLKNNGAISPALSVKPDKSNKPILHLNGRPALEIPKKSRAYGWRTTVNKSLLPRSVSAESRRHILFALLQDLIQQDLRLKKDTGSVNPLEDLDQELAPFEHVYHVPGGENRPILFPLHISVPTVFDTYVRNTKQQPQTDKGFRGPFIEFFSSDDTGFLDPHLRELIQKMFAPDNADLPPLDRALVESLGEKVTSGKETELRALMGDPDYQNAQNGNVKGWWGNVYEKPPPGLSQYRPLEAFAEQGRRLMEDIDGIIHTPGLSRLEQVDFVERILAYHFAIYMVRLPNVLYDELDWAYKKILGKTSSPWSDHTELQVRYHDRRIQVPNAFHDEYKELVNGLNEAYLLLPVLNNIELAVRAVANSGGASATMRDLCWVEAKNDLNSFTPAQFGELKEILSFLAELGCEFSGFDSTALGRKSNPIELLFGAVRSHYTEKSQRRYPKNHHETVFVETAGHGPTSFLQRNQKKSHFVLGDELIYLLVLVLFEHRDATQRRKTPIASQRVEKELRRIRLPLREFEERLEYDLMVPADEESRRDLRSALSRLGLLERLSDVGEANFLRHPTGV